MSKAKEPKKEKLRPIEIVSVKRTRKTIVIAWRQGDASFDLEERDNPLPSFVTALDALTPIVATVCHLPAEYVAQGCVVTKFTLAEVGQAPTVQFTANKDIDDAQKLFQFVTPPKLLRHPTQPGKYTPPLDPHEADLVAEAIEEAKRYVKGERAQGEIAFEGDDDDAGAGEEPSNIEPLPGLADAGKDSPDTSGPRKKKKRGKLAAAGDSE